MKSSFRTILHLLVVLSLILTSIFAAVTPAGASPEQQSLSAAPYAADSILVKFKPGTPGAEKANAHAAVQGQVVTEYSLVPGLQQLRLPVDKISVEKAVEILSHRPSVEYAEPDYIVQATVDPPPNDPLYLDNSLWGMANIRAPAAWESTTGTGSFVVADIDTGLDYEHPDIADNVWTNPGEIADNGIDEDGNGYVDDVRGWDFAYGDNNPSDVHGHGTHTAGTIGAKGNNGTGVVGVNWNVKIMPLKFLDDSGSGSMSGAISALDYAVSTGVKVSNNSWGWGCGGYYCYSSSMFSAIKNAGLAGHLFIAAAGNDGTDNDSSRFYFYPASYNLDNIISVAAIDSAEQKASWSNYGATSVDLGAPGVNIYSTKPGGSYQDMSGTSMATPHVAGVAALLWGLKSDWTYRQVRSRILSTARPIPALSGKTVTGGTLDAGKALAGLTPPSAPAPPSGLEAAFVSSTQIDLTWIDNSNNESGFKIERCQGAGCGTFAQITTVGAGVVSYNNAGLTASTPYSYRVRAYNASGDSAYSDTVGATTLAAPAVPSVPADLMATVASRSQINLTWTHNSNNETGFKIERCRGATCNNFTQIATVGANVTTYSSTGLKSRTDYRYRVRAYNAAGNSAYSNVVSAKTR